MITKVRPTSDGSSDTDITAGKVYYITGMWKPNTSMYNIYDDNRKVEGILVIPGCGCAFLNGGRWEVLA